MRKVSIVPRGRALGVTFQSPDVERYGYDAAYLRGRITGALGGRAAEELVYEDITTGAESDLEQVTRIARQMVGRWGMSEAIGPVSILPAPGQEQIFLPGSPMGCRRRRATSSRRRPGGSSMSATPARSTSCAENRARLDRVAHALLEHETLDEADAYRVAGVGARRAVRARRAQPGAVARPRAVKSWLPRREHERR